jgi:hypothetical protein
MRQRELLQRCLKALEEQSYYMDLIKDIRAELEKPEEKDWLIERIRFLEKQIAERKNRELP